VTTLAPPRCAWCGDPFTPNAHGRPRVYCGVSCYQRAYYEAHRAKLRESAARRWGWDAYLKMVCERCRVGYQTHAKKPRVLCGGCRAEARALLRRKPDPICESCGATFTRKGGTDKFCCVEHRPPQRSPEQNRAKNHVRRVARRGIGYEDFPEVYICERDGWRCAICKRKVTPSRFKRDPEGPSLDHIIPVSEGGRHSRANCRLTHLRCNVARGVRGDVQLLLIG
jgi:hypothetical protein